MKTQLALPLGKRLGMHCATCGIVASGEAQAEAMSTTPASNSIFIVGANDEAMVKTLREQFSGDSNRTTETNRRPGGSMKDLLAQIEDQYHDELQILANLRQQVAQQEVKCVKIEGAIEFGRQVVARDEAAPAPSTNGASEPAIMGPEV